MRRILVTGGSGFLGSHLCEYLLKDKCNVICIDNFFTGNDSNIHHLKNNPNFELIQHDIISPISLIVDEIYNLACPASPIKYQSDPIQTIKINIYGAINILNLAKTNNAKIFQASTSEIYGDAKTHPQVENYWGNVNPIGIRACYNEGKRCAETLFFDYHRQYNLNIKVARIFNTYGPRMCVNDGRVISNFIVQALQNKPIIIFGSGEQTRSFCYVDDLIKSFIRFMATPNNFIGPVNLGNSTEITILNLAKKIIKLTNSKSKIIFKTSLRDDPKQRKPDITLAKKVLDWEAKINLEEGLKKTIDYFLSIGV